MKTPRFILPALLLVCLTAALRAASVDSHITAVTVYADRAVVTRTASLDVAEPGPLEMVFENLPASLVDQSLQVAGRGTAQTTILDVTAREAYLAATPDGRVKSLEDALRGLQQQHRVLDDRATVLDHQRGFLAAIKTASAAPPTKDAPRPSVEDWTKLLTFFDEQFGKLNSEQQTLDTQRHDLADKIGAIEKQIADLSGANGRSIKHITVRLTATNPGHLELALSYTVPAASWSPSYDARVLSTDHAVQLGYFGVVHQSTGEDWTNVDLTLSTARPSLGGAPPQLFPWTVDVAQFKSEDQKDGETTIALGSFNVSAAKSVGYRANNSVSGGMPSPPIQDLPFSVSAFSEATLDAQATSASFKIPVAATIPSDNSPQKVPITSVRLADSPEYLAIPKQLAAAFLTAKVTNSSDFPLLAGTMNVFLDDTFVAASSLRTVMPGEKFDLALGVDDAIAIKRKLNNRFTEDTGLISKGQRVTYDCTLTVQNNKKTSERVVLLDQVPVSRNEKIVVKMLAPDVADVKPEADGTLKWTLDLKPGEKRELSLKFSVEHPADLAVAGLE
ncbi:MAG TPA: mucoidy inhibitor MuiA family protein [Opitutaceae bacterium]|nr:mucoidy inhibitor MuiA family protein [Opitutaceae bacterium]